MHILDREKFRDFITKPTQTDQIHLFHRNGTFDWYAMDTEELFNSNLKADPTNKHLLHYQKHPFTYKTNEYGFRTEDSFDTKEAGNVYLGDSHTFGIGLPIENTWSYLVNKEVGGKFFNLGIPGSGSATALRTLLNWSNKLNIERIFHYAPLYARYEYIIRGRNTTIDCIHSIFNTGDLKHSLVDENYITRYTLTNILAIQAVADKLNVPYYVITDKEAHNRFEPGHNDDLNGTILARDLIHYSNTEHKIFSELFLEKVNIKQ